MAKFVVTSNAISLNGSDISANCARAELALTAAEVDVTDFGSSGWTEVIGGLKSGTVSLDFHSDFGSGAVSALFQDLIGTIGTVTLIAGNGTAASGTTPEYTAEVLINSFTPVAGAVGDLSTFTVSFPTTGEVSYATA
jgi:hypothetical protein